MKNLFLFLSLVLVVQTQAQKSKPSKAQQKSFVTKEMVSNNGKYTYKIVEGDPLGVRVYKLKNGLTVMLSVNKKEPRIQTFIATNAGSKNDPTDNTGLAHYLEHMLFKGTDTYGTKDWKKEKEQLDKIDALYELYNKTTDDKKRTEIYHLIDSVSGVASKFAIANEYDKMLTAIGAQGTNAFTSLEQTVYVNDIAQNQISKWLTIEAERFRAPVLRLFHTELEAVYEEKNIVLDNDGRKVYEALLSNLFKSHPYGTQSTIGTVEHLKNPSLVKIRNFYNTYYVPNNMAIILSGDFNPDEVIAEIDEKFSYMQTKPVPTFVSPIEKVSNEPKIVNVYGPDAENLMIGFRLPGSGTKEEKLLTMCDMILANSKAGLIDLNLIKKQAVLSASSSAWINHDYSIFFLTGSPKEGQSLEEVKQLLLNQIEKVKKGEFDENILKAIIANFKINKIEEQKSNQGRAYAMLDAFTLGRNWQNSVTMIEDMNQITKAEIVEFANKYLTNDYVVVYKKIGEDKNITKVPKPAITPVDVNRDDVSPFVNKIKNTPNNNIKPRFVDYQNDLTIDNFGGKAPIYYVQNKDNDLFQLYYVLDMGKFHDLKLPIAINLLQFLGTDKMSSEEISKEFFKLACNFNVSTSNEQVYVTLSGLNENFDASVKLFETLLANAKPDDAALKSYIERTLKARTDAKLNKGAVRSALMAYAMYGAKNPNTYLLTEAELKNLNATDLVQNYIKKISQYKHKIYYFGPRAINDFKKSLALHHKLPKVQLEYPKAIEFVRNATAENKVFFTNYSMVQAEVSWINKSNFNYDSTKAPVIQLFNEYFGGGMGSLVFQTIRESKALAYSTYSFYQSPSKKTDPYYTIAYVGTQADKINEAIPAMNELLNTLPYNEANIENAKASIKNNIETERINDESVIFNYVSNQKLGINHDIRKDIYENIDQINFTEMNNFYKANYAGKPYFYTIVASKEKVNLNDLAKYGQVIEVSISDIFGY